MRGFIRRREHPRDDWPHNDWLYLLGVVFVIFVLYEALR